MSNSEIHEAISAILDRHNILHDENKRLREIISAELDAVEDDVRWADGPGEMERLVARRDALRAAISGEEE